jgi:hypothetical protein
VIFLDFREELKEDIYKFQHVLAMMEQKSEIVRTKLITSDEIRKKIAALKRNSDFISGMSCKVFTSS